MKKSITAGIDFGNQACVLSIPTRYGVDVVLNQSSNRKTPTIVGYSDGRRYSGEFALQQQMMNISNTITHIKQLIGLKYHSTERENLCNSIPYKIVCLENDNLCGIQLEDNTILRPEQIIAFLLKSLLDIIQIRNQDIEQIILTIPPHWNELQRRSILHTASISNVKIASLLNTTTAAAVSYVKIHSDRFSENFDKKFNALFIDVGDSSINAAVASLSKKSIDMKSFVYDKSISGHFFTQKLNEYLIQKVREKYKIDPNSNKRASVRFWQATEKVKKDLSANSIMMFEIPSLMNDIDVSIPVKRDEFNELFDNISEKIECLIQKVIYESGFSKDDIQTVEFIGGGSRMPAIKCAFKKFFGCEPMMSLDLDECFAIGAGYMAAKEDGYDIGIDVINSVYIFEVKVEFEYDGQIHSEIVFNKNSKMPSNRTFSIPIKENNSFFLLSDDVRIGCGSIKTGCSEKVDVIVTVLIDSFGLIDICGGSYLNDKSEKIDVAISYSPFNFLSSEKVAEFARIEEKMEIKDKLEIEIDNTKNRLESLIFSTENELNSVSILNETDKAEITSIKSKVTLIHNWFEENEFERLSLDKYKAKIKEIDEQIDRVSIYKKYIERLAFLDEMKQELIYTQIILNKNSDKIEPNLLDQLQSDITNQIIEIDEISSLPKAVILKADINSIYQNIRKISNEIYSNIKNYENNNDLYIKHQNEHQKNFKSKDDQNSIQSSEKVEGQIFDQQNPTKSTLTDCDEQDSEKVTDENSKINQKSELKIIQNQSAASKPPLETALSSSKKKINIVNINNDELTKQSLRSSRSFASNPQKSRVKLPPMSPRQSKNQMHQSNIRNRAARPILQNNPKAAPSLVHPQSQRENVRHSPRQRVNNAAAGGGVPIVPPVKQAKKQRSSNESLP